MSALTITRADLIKLTEQTVTRRGNGLSREDRKLLRETAATMESVALGDWRINSKCGCIVGIAFKDVPMDQLYEIDLNVRLAGLQFDELLGALMNRTTGYSRRLDRPARIRVIDEPVAA